MKCLISALSVTSGSLFKYETMLLNGEQEKESIICVRMGSKNVSLAITDCPHSASLVVPNPHTQDRF